jgi:hypothetical protein
MDDADRSRPIRRIRPWRALIAVGVLALAACDDGADDPDPAPIAPGEATVPVDTNSEDVRVPLEPGSNLPPGNTSGEQSESEGPPPTG